MIRTAKKIYCDNEHGVGDVFFPEDGDYISMLTVAEIRRRAKAAGWLRTKRNDYCPQCAIDELELTEDEKEERRLALEAK